jgi:mannose-6-phosphate isomerase-like protein (cupin superfamily)
MSNDAHSIAALIGSIARLYTEAPCDAAKPLLEAAVAVIEGLSPPAAIPLSNDPPSLAVLALLGAALADAARGELAPIAAGFEAVARRLPWSQNPNYVAAPPSPDFLDRYGYCEVIGPGRIVESARLRLGFLLLAPGTLYPRHHHPAEEVYHVVAGAGAWQRGDEAWRPEPVGAAIHHPSMMPHATRAGNEPLLALYVWGGSIDTHARIEANRDDGHDTRG